MNDSALASWGDQVAPDELRFDPDLHTVAARATPHGGEWRHFWELTLTMTRSELKQRYFGSVLGYFWTLLRPLMLFAVLYFIFTYVIFRAGSKSIAHYPEYLLMSLVLWTYFAETTTIGVTSLVAREGLMRKINFPRIAVPISLAMTTGFHLLMNLAVVTIFILISGVAPTFSWLMALPLIAAFIGFTIGAAMLLSTLYVKFRDVAPIWEVFVTLMFWASPIIYVASFPGDSGHKTLQRVLGASPVSASFSSLRHWVIDPSAPGAAGILGGRTFLIIPIGIAVAVMAAGYTAFTRIAPNVAEDL